MRKRSPKEKFNLQLRMIHAIGHRTFAQKMTFKNGKTKMMHGIKKKDGEATFDEMKSFLKNVLDTPLPSERTLREYLHELIEDNFVQSTGQRGRKKAIYSLTKEGKLLQWEFDRYSGFQQAFLTKWFKATPLLMGHTRTPEGKEVMETYMVISDPEEVELLLKAGRFVVSKTGNELEFFKDCARAQKLGLLWYCMSLVDPRFLVFMKKFSLKELLQNEVSMKDFFKEVLDFSEESGLLSQG